jgi:hypothetical protein
MQTYESKNVTQMIVKLVLDSTSTLGKGEKNSRCTLSIWNKANLPMNNVRSQQLWLMPRFLDSVWLGKNIWFFSTIIQRHFENNFWWNIQILYKCGPFLIDGTKQRDVRCVNNYRRLAPSKFHSLLLGFDLRTPRTKERETQQRHTNKWYQERE